MKFGLISMSLYQKSWALDSRYLLGILESIKWYPILWKGFDWHIYYDDTVSKILLELLSNNSVTLIKQNTHQGTNGMFWRYKALFNQEYKYVITADLDRPINHHYRFVFDKYLQSGKLAGTRFTFPGQYQQVGLVGDTVFIQPSALKEHLHLLDDINNWCSKYAIYGYDEIWLHNEIYPIIKHSLYNQFNTNVDFSDITTDRTRRDYQPTRWLLDNYLIHGNIDYVKTIDNNFFVSDNREIAG